MCQSEGTHQIVMSFSPPVVGCLLTTSSQKGGGGSQAPQDPPLATPLLRSVGGQRLVRGLDSLVQGQGQIFARPVSSKGVLKRFHRADWGKEVVNFKCAVPIES